MLAGDTVVSESCLEKTPVFLLVPQEQMLWRKSWGTEQAENSGILRNLNIILWEFLQKAVLGLCSRGQ